LTAAVENKAAEKQKPAFPATQEQLLRSSKGLISE
jgi:hypothetical protein